MTKIEVTQDHIRAGVKCDPLRCPVSLAIAESFLGFTVFVDQSEIAFYSLYDKKTRTITPPEQVKAFISSYDLGEDVAPFSFDLSI